MSVTFSIAIVMLGLSAAVGGPWPLRPRTRQGRSPHMTSEVRGIALSIIVGAALLYGVINTLIKVAELC